MRAEAIGVAQFVAARRAKPHFSSEATKLALLVEKIPANRDRDAEKNDKPAGDDDARIAFGASADLAAEEGEFESGVLLEQMQGVFVRLAVGIAHYT